ncbi:hypothetical protein F4861DRAFT_544535 [Xylaria intraflava]|nr:hypothetical protein F4861DRAFT_544535 [Xylaria intraflava]
MAALSDTIDADQDLNERLEVASPSRETQGVTGAAPDSQESEEELTRFTHVHNFGADWFSVAEKKTRTLRVNRLGQDERRLQGCKTSEEYWIKVLTLTPPHPWIDRQRLINHLATARAYDKPANNKAWGIAEEWIRQARL